MSLENNVVEDEDNLFTKIIDPETNHQVLLESAVGQQVIKNYIECLRNGPESENIISTKMFYKKPKQSNVNNAKGLSIENIYEYAKNLDVVQYSGRELKQMIKGAHRKTPEKGNKVWIRRSSGKWQRAVISSVILDQEGQDAKCNVYFNADNNNIGSKKNLDIDDILFY